MYSSIMLEKCMNNFDIECERQKLSNILKFCRGVCGERSHQYLVSSVEDSLPHCLDFEQVSALHFERGKLFSLKRMKSDTGELLVQGLTELPLGVGVTGRALAEGSVVASAYGKSDVDYDEQVDNVFKIKHLENIVVVPLLVDHGKVIGKESSKELVGVLQLINGDLSKLNAVLSRNHS